MQTEYDIIIIGGGSAGCVLANRLSTEGPSGTKYRVLVVEAGESSLNVLFSYLPGAFGQMFHDERWDYNYFTVPQKGCHGRKMFQPRGKMLGGCSSINAEMYHRGPASDYNRWSTLLSDPSWSYSSLLPLFRKSEHFQALPSSAAASSDYITPAEHISPDYHGFDGEWKISYRSYFHKISGYFIKAAEKVGIPFNYDFNGKSTLGCGRIQTFVDAQECMRSNTEKAFLSQDVKARENLHVLTSAKCLRLTIEDGKCTGAVILHRGQEIHLKAKRQVIVSCGAFDSPRILKASGVSLPGVGKNLQDHLGINISFKVPSAADKSLTTADQWNGFINKFVTLYKYFVYRTGPAASNLGEAVAFYRTRLSHVLADDRASGDESPHVELIAVPALVQHHEGQQSLVRIRPDFDWSRFEFRGRYITIVPLLLNPYSAGEVRYGDNGEIEIDPQYFTDKRDIDVLVEGVKVVRRIVKEGYAALGLEGMEEVVPGEHLESDAQIESFIRSNAETYYHPVGTCKMGREGDEMAVVDSRLRVFGVEGLRVVDASVMPVIVAAHTCAPTLVIAEKAAEMILEDLAKGV